jgi:GNAT superfamily N-acetyltransferase
MTAILVRAGTSHDLAALTNLNGDVQALHVASRPDQFKPVDLRQIEGWVVDLLRSPSARVWVAELDGTVIGYAVATRCERAETPFLPQRVWWDLDAIGVRVENQRRGVGRALVERVVSEARSQGISEIELNSWAFNAAAQAAFRRLGFTLKAARFELRVSEAGTSDST